MKTVEAKSRVRKALQTLDVNQPSKRLRLSKSSQTSSSIETRGSSTIPIMDDSEFAFLQRPATSRSVEIKVEGNVQQDFRTLNGMQGDEKHISRRKTPRTSNCSTSSIGTSSNISTALHDKKILSHQNIAEIEALRNARRMKETTQIERRKKLWKKHFKQTLEKPNENSSDYNSTSDIPSDLDICRGDITEQQSLSSPMCINRTDQMKCSQSDSTCRNSSRNMARAVRFDACSEREHLQNNDITVNGKQSYSKRNSLAHELAIKKRNCNIFPTPHDTYSKPESVKQEYAPDDAHVWKAMMEIPNNSYRSMIHSDNHLNTLVAISLPKADGASLVDFDDCSTLTNITGMDTRTTDMEMDIPIQDKIKLVVTTNDPKESKTVLMGIADMTNQIHAMDPSYDTNQVRNPDSPVEASKESCAKSDTNALVFCEAKTSCHMELLALQHGRTGSNTDTVRNQKETRSVSIYRKSISASVHCAKVLVASEVELMSRFHTTPTQINSSMSRNNKHASKCRLDSLRKLSEATQFHINQESAESWTAEHAAKVHDNEKFGQNIAPIFEINGKLYKHPPLPPGWTIGVSKSKGRPYYLHPNFGISWFPPVPLPSRDGTVKCTSLLIQAATISKPKALVAAENDCNTTGLVGESRTFYIDTQTPYGFEIASKDPNFSSSSQTQRTPNSRVSTSVGLSENGARVTALLGINQFGGPKASGIIQPFCGIPEEIVVDKCILNSPEQLCNNILSGTPCSQRSALKNDLGNSLERKHTFFDASPGSCMVSCSEELNMDLHEVGYNYDNEHQCAVVHSQERKVEACPIVVQRPLNMDSESTFSSPSLQSLISGYSPGGFGFDAHSRQIESHNSENQDDTQCTNVQGSIELKQRQSSQTHPIKVVEIFKGTNSKKSAESPIQDTNEGLYIYENDSYTPLNSSLPSTKRSCKVHLNKNSSPQRNCDNDEFLSSNLFHSIDVLGKVEDHQEMQGCFNYKGSSHRIRVGYETWRALMPKLPVCSLQRTQRADMMPTKKAPENKQ